MTWNANAPARASSDWGVLPPAVTSADVARLQEMTPGARGWLGAKLGERYDVLIGSLGLKDREFPISRMIPAKGLEVFVEHQCVRTVE